MVSALLAIESKHAIGLLVPAFRIWSLCIKADLLTAGRYVAAQGFAVTLASTATCTVTPDGLYAMLRHPSPKFAAWQLHQDPSLSGINQPRLSAAVKGECCCVLRAGSVHDLDRLRDYYPGIAVRVGK